MTNQEVSELMQRFLDDDLNEEELKSLMEHIQQSPASAELFERLQRLDSDLELLPKVIPPMSIVDSILPRLELAGLIDHPHIVDTTASEDLPSRVASLERRTALRERINYRWLGGVVAAGIVLTLTITSLGPDMIFNSADKDAASTHQIMDAKNVTEGASTLKKSDDPNQLVFTAAKSDNTADSATSQSEPEAAPEAPQMSEADTNDPAQGESQLTERASDSRFGGTATDNPSESDQDKAMPSASTDNTIPGENETEEPMLSIARSTPEVASPNELLMGTIAVTADGAKHIVIRDLVTGQQLYESAEYQGALNELTWSPDSTQLYYEVTLDNESTVQMTIDLATLTESKKATE